MAEVETLTTVWDARFDKLEAKLNNVVRANYGAASKIEKAWDGVNDKMDRSFSGAGPGFAKFNAGALGAAAGAGLAALAISGLAAAFNQTREALKFTADLANTAANLHLTTDALQAYNFAVIESGGKTGDAAKSLENFSEKFGQAQQRATGAVNAFKSIGFSQAQIDGFKTTDDALKAVISHISELKNGAQRDAALKAFGLEGLKPALRDGEDGLQRLLDGAKAAGAVMDADLIRRGAELDKQIEAASQRIDVQFKTALVNAGPAIVFLLEKMAELAKLAADVADTFARLENKSSGHLLQLAEEFRQRDQGPLGAVFRPGDEGPNGRIARINKVLAERAAADRAEAAKANAGGSRSLIDTNKNPKGPRDDTEQRTEQVNATLAAAQVARLQAELSLTKDVEDRAKIEREIAAQEQAQAIARLEKQKADIDADKGISAATKATLKAKLDEAETAAKAAAQAKLTLINEEEEFGIRRYLLDAASEYNDLLNRQTAAQASMTGSARRRAELELQIFKYKQDQALLEYEYIQDLKVRNNEITQATRDANVADFRKTQGAELTAERDRQNIATNPVAAFVRANQGADVFMEKLEQIGVEGFNNLADALAEAAVNGENLGEVLNNVLKQIIAQALSATIKGVGADIGSALLGLIPGFASGTDSAPGGLALVGERGPELVRLSKGSQVVPTNRTMAALRNLTVPATSRSPIVHLTNYELHSPVVTADLLAQMRTIGAMSKRDAVMEATRISRNGALARQAQLEALGT